MIDHDALLRHAVHVVQARRPAGTPQTEISRDSVELYRVLVEQAGEREAEQAITRAWTRDYHGFADRLYVEWVGRLDPETFGEKDFAELCGVLRARSFEAALVAMRDAA